LRKAVNGLTEKERRFQPTPESHHIDFAVWHMARVEDDYIQRFAQRADTVWQREGWFTKLGLPERDSGFGYKAEQVASLPKFDFDGMMAYYDAVRRETNRYLDSITAETLDHVPHPERRPGYTIGKMFSHVIVEEAQHVGQVAYLRGMQRGLGK
ncbi:MAG: DinB family protein, partial [Chloroflexi bacterium]|nr:DinB family protein [Chloroflexota bacterium]